MFHRNYKYGVGRNYGLIEKMGMDTENNDVGRPPYIKTDEDSKTVEALAIAGVKQSLIADIVKS